MGWKSTIILSTVGLGVLAYLAKYVMGWLRQRKAAAEEFARLTAEAGVRRAERDAQIHAERAASYRAEGDRLMDEADRARDRANNPLPMTDSEASEKARRLAARVRKVDNGSGALLGLAFSCVLMGLAATSEAQRFPTPDQDMDTPVRLVAGAPAPSDGWWYSNRAAARLESMLVSREDEVKAVRKAAEAYRQAADEAGRATTQMKQEVDYLEQQLNMARIEQARLAAENSMLRQRVEGAESGRKVWRRAAIVSFGILGYAFRD